MLDNPHSWFRIIEYIGHSVKLMQVFLQLIIRDR